jgi:hypothetical protein
MGLSAFAPERGASPSYPYVRNGDQLWAFTHSVTTGTAFGTPSGWTKLFDVAAGTAAWARIALFRRNWSTGDPTTTTFTQTAGIVFAGLMVVRSSRVGAGSWTVVAGAQQDNNAASTNMLVKRVIPTHQRDLRLYFVWTNNQYGTGTPQPTDATINNVFANWGLIGPSIIASTSITGFVFGGWDTSPFDAADANIVQRLSCKSYSASYSITDTHDEYGAVWKLRPRLKVIPATTVLPGGGAAGVAGGIAVY